MENRMCSVEGLRAMQGRNQVRHETVRVTKK